MALTALRGEVETVGFGVHHQELSDAPFRSRCCVHALARRRCTRGAIKRTGGTKRLLGIEDYYRIKTIGGVTLSPDGQTVTFTVSMRNEENNGNTTESWMVPWDGSAPARRVTADSGSVGASGRGGRGGRGGDGASATRSSDGQWLFAIRDVAQPVRQLAADTPFEKRHAERFKGIQFDWLDYQRDGGQYPLPNVADPYVSPPQEIFVAPSVGRGATGGAERQLTKMGLRPSGAQWSNDGTRILFTGDSLYRSEKSYGRSEAFLVTVADGKITRLTPDARHDYRGARYSPDGKWILVTRQLTTDHVIAKKLNYGGATDLVVIPPPAGRNETSPRLGTISRAIRSGAPTASPSTSRAASAARCISSTCHPKAGRCRR